MERLIKKTICNLLYESGLLKFALLFLKRIKKGIIILTYHKVNLKGVSWGISLEEFTKQMEFIRKNFRVISSKEACNYIEGESRLKSSAVVITFDDGYRNNYLYAYPCLKKFGLKATMFLSTDFIDTDKRFPWAEKDTCLSWEEVKALASDGIEFGAHAKSHPDLTSLCDDELKEQVEGSKRIIEKKLNKEVFSFAYPYGYFDERVRRIVRDAGFKLACTTIQGANHPDDDLFLLKRIGPENVFNIGHLAWRMAKVLLFERKYEGCNCG